MIVQWFGFLWGSLGLLTGPGVRSAKHVGRGITEILGAHRNVHKSHSGPGELMGSWRERVGVKESGRHPVMRARNSLGLNGTHGIRNMLAPRLFNYESRTRIAPAWSKRETGWQQDCKSQGAHTPEEFENYARPAALTSYTVRPHAGPQETGASHSFGKASCSCKRKGRGSVYVLGIRMTGVVECGA